MGPEPGYWSASAQRYAFSLRGKQGAKGRQKGVFRYCGSGADEASRRIDHLLQAAGNLEIAEPARRQPFKVVIFVVEFRLTADPARRKRHDQVVPAVAGSRHHLEPSGEVQDL